MCFSSSLRSVLPFRLASSLTEHGRTEHPVRTSRFTVEDGTGELRARFFATDGEAQESWTASTVSTTVQG